MPNWNSPSVGDLIAGKEKPPLVGSYTFPSERRPIDGSPQLLCLCPATADRGKSDRLPYLGGGVRRTRADIPGERSPLWDSAPWPGTARSPSSDRPPARSGPASPHEDTPRRGRTRPPRPACPVRTDHRGAIAKGWPRARTRERRTRRYWRGWIDHAGDRYGLSDPGVDGGFQEPNFDSYSFSRGARMRSACSGGRDKSSAWIQERTC